MQAKKKTKKTKTKQKTKTKTKKQKKNSIVKATPNQNNTKKGIIMPDFKLFYRARVYKMHGPCIKQAGSSKK